MPYLQCMKEKGIDSMQGVVLLDTVTKVQLTPVMLAIVDIRL